MIEKTLQNIALMIHKENSVDYHSRIHRHYDSNILRKHFVICLDCFAVTLGVEMGYIPATLLSLLYFKNLTAIPLQSKETTGISYLYLSNRHT